MDEILAFFPEGRHSRPKVQLRPKSVKFLPLSERMCRHFNTVVPYLRKKPTRELIILEPRRQDYILSRSLPIFLVIIIYR